MRNNSGSGSFLIPLALAFWGMLSCPWLALAQLTPERTYYGVDRAIPIAVSLPGGTGGEASIVLYNAKGDRMARASVLAGPIDLAAFFPILWDQPTPSCSSPSCTQIVARTNRPIDPSARRWFSSPC